MGGRVQRKTLACFWSVKYWQGLVITEHFASIPTASELKGGDNLHISKAA